MGLDCIVLYNPVVHATGSHYPAVPVTSKHFDGSRLYNIHVLYNPAVPVTDTHYDGFKLDYCTVLELDKWGSMNTSQKPRDFSKID